MATRKSQRIGIAIILAVTIIGTIGSFAVMILGQQNQEQQAAHLKAENDAYQKQLAAYTATQTADLTSKYYPTLSQYASRVGTFDRDSVSTLSTEDLLVGDGVTIDGTTSFSAFYIGWMPDGKIFEQSIVGATLTSPILVSTGLDKASLIDGWKEGMKGMRIGGVRLLTIPSDKAYKEKGSTDSSGKEIIPPNTSLKFVVLAVPTPDDSGYPQMPADLLQATYGSGN